MNDFIKEQRIRLAKKLENKIFSYDEYHEVLDIINTFVVGKEEFYKEFVSVVSKYFL